MSYQVGDTIWYAQCGMATVSSTCPVCFGERSVNLILGNGEIVRLSCDYCGRGYLGPIGYVQETMHVAGAERRTITGITTRSTVDGVVTEYFSEQGTLIAEDMFDNQEDAEARSREKANAYNADVLQRNAHVKKYSNAKYSWRAGYHMRESKKHREEAARHDEWAKICQERSRETNVTKGGSA